MNGAVGIIGSALLVLAWLPSTMRVWRKRESDMPLAYSLLLCSGVGLLLVYSWLLGDAIFVCLNIAVLAIGLYNIWFIPRKRQQMNEWVHEVEELIGRKNKYYVVKKQKRLQAKEK